MDASLYSYDGSAALTDYSALEPFSSESDSLYVASYTTGISGTESADAVGALDVNLSTGDGYDYLNVWASANGTSSTLEAAGLLGTSTGSEQQQSVLDTGADSDYVSINASANGNQWQWQLNPDTGSWESTLTQADQATAVGIDNYTVNLGDGDDSLNVSASASGADPSATGILDSNVDTGTGSDYVNVSAWTSDSTTWDPAVGIQDTNLSTGDGYDYLNVWASANGTSSTLEAAGLLGTSTGSEQQQSVLDTGADSDYVSINASANGNQWQWQLNPDTGSWESTLTQADQATAVGIDNYTVNLGDGDDSLNVSASASGLNTSSTGLLNTIIDTGTGNDTAIISASAIRTDSTTSGLSANKAEINLGSGDDNLVLNGGTVDSIVRGGEGSDRVQISGVNTEQITTTRTGGQSYDISYTLSGVTYSLKLESVETIVADNGSISLDYSPLPESTGQAPTAPSNQGESSSTPSNQATTAVTRGRSSRSGRSGSGRNSGGRSTGRGRR